MSLKNLSLASGTILLAGVVFGWVTNPVMGQLPIPEDFSYTETKPLSAVPFSHKLHVTERKLTCQECHTNIFQMKKHVASPAMTMAKLNEGQFCGACHNGTRAFATKEFQSCVKCHVQK